MRYERTPQLILERLHMNNKIDELLRKIRNTKPAFEKVKLIEDLEKEIAIHKKLLVTTYLKEMR